MSEPRAATIVISDWLANCQVGQWTPFEAATALKAALTKEGYEIRAAKPERERVIEAAEILERRAQGYKQRGAVIFNGHLVSEDLYALATQIRALKGDPA